MFGHVASFMKDFLASRFLGGKKYILIPNPPLVVRIWFTKTVKQFQHPFRTFQNIKLLLCFRIWKHPKSFYIVVKHAHKDGNILIKVELILFLPTSTPFIY